MKTLARLYGAKQALIVHAAATNYRDRSHFDGQDVLESGWTGPGWTESGWLNRAVAALPGGQRVSPARRWLLAMSRRSCCAAPRRSLAGRRLRSRRRMTISPPGC